MTSSDRLRRRLLSFRYALAGLRILLRTQPNARIHAFVALLVVGLGLSLDLATAEWLWLVVAILAVWAAEAFNTALEFLADAVTLDHHPLIEQAKDVAAAAVLLTSLGAVVIGALVLGPHVLRWLV